MEKYLVILEVSQKQAYIFKSKSLSDNIEASEIIRYVTDTKYFEEIYKNQEYLVEGEYGENDNMVYSGGGHTILEFPTREAAQMFARTISRDISHRFPELELFIKIVEYDYSKCPSDNLKELTKQLERKKSKRESAFSNGTFGIEAFSQNVNNERKLKIKFPDGFTEVFEEAAIGDYKLVKDFSRLGGSKNKSNFIAVIHIDGNLMGKRVASLYEAEGKNGFSEDDWKAFKEKIRSFSEGIDKDFKAAYAEMLTEVKVDLDENRLLDLNLEGKDFPVRRIITAGDDVCIVSEGRIGLECARIFLEKLWNKKNIIDGNNYSACAGVAIVHQKYPFYKAYKIAEGLCDNAKKQIAKLVDNDDQGVNVSAIDWHMDFGEMYGSVGELKEKYLALDGTDMSLRPYIVCGDGKFLNKDKIRRYEGFKNYVKYLKERKLTEDSVASETKTARSKIKGLRTVLKEGKRTAEYYIKSQLIEDIVYKAYDEFKVQEINTEDLSKNSSSIYVKPFGSDGECTLCFDAIEVMDTFIEIKGAGEYEN